MSSDDRRAQQAVLTVATTQSHLYLAKKALVAIVRCLSEGNGIYAGLNTP